MHLSKARGIQYWVIGFEMIGVHESRKKSTSDTLVLRVPTTVRPIHHWPTGLVGGKLWVPQLHKASNSLDNLWLAWWFQTNVLVIPNILELVDRSPGQAHEHSGPFDWQVFLGLAAARSQLNGAPEGTLSSAMMNHH